MEEEESLFKADAVNEEGEVVEEKFLLKANDIVAAMCVA